MLIRCAEEIVQHGQTELCAQILIQIWLEKVAKDEVLGGKFLVKLVFAGLGLGPVEIVGSQEEDQMAVDAIETLYVMEFIKQVKKEENSSLNRPLKSC